MAPSKLLLVDDDETVLNGLQAILEAHQFDVTVASNVNEALRQIMSTSFDVLVSDLHMPDPGDGLTVVSAMRHAHPSAVTIVVSAYPDMEKACAEIIKQADEVVLKPVRASGIVDLIRQRLAKKPRPTQSRAVQAVAALLEEQTAAITRGWLAQMESGGSLRTVALSVEERCEHLPDALRDIIFRLRYPQPMGSRTLFSMAALQHGARRRRQGIPAATMVEESRALQVALFQAVEENMGRMNLGEVPRALMAIADEVNAQLAQSLEGYENEQPVEVPWGFR